MSLKEREGERLKIGADKDVDVSSYWKTLRKREDNEI
jgi:hypothetical protein